MTKRKCRYSIGRKKGGAECFRGQKQELQIFLIPPPPSHSEPQNWYTSNWSVLRSRISFLTLRRCEKKKETLYFSRILPSSFLPPSAKPGKRTGTRFRRIGSSTKRAIYSEINQFLKGEKRVFPFRGLIVWNPNKFGRKTLELSLTIFTFLLRSPRGAFTLHCCQVQRLHSRKKEWKKEKEKEKGSTEKIASV